MTSTAIPTRSVASERQERAGNEAVGPGDERGGEIRAQHVERAMREVHQVHDAEDKREPRRKQEQQQPELQTVEALFEEEQHRGLRTTERRSARQDDISLCPSCRPSAASPISPLHRALVVELVLAVLDDGGNGLERQIAVVHP